MELNSSDLNYENTENEESEENFDEFQENLINTKVKQILRILYSI